MYCSPNLRYPKYPRNVIKSTKFCRSWLYSRIFRELLWDFENVLEIQSQIKPLPYYYYIPMYPTVLVFFSQRNWFLPYSTHHLTSSPYICTTTHATALPHFKKPQVYISYFGLNSCDTHFSPKSFKLCINSYVPRYTKSVKSVLCCLYTLMS